MRYIDDGIIILPDVIATEQFLEILNMMHQAIQYTGSGNESCVVNAIRYKRTNFLSIKVLVNTDNIVKFDVYYKDTNAHDYLAYDSHHPEHTKMNIPYVLSKRIIIISN